MALRSMFPLMSFPAVSLRRWHNFPSQVRLALIGFLVSIGVVFGLITGHLIYNYRETTHFAEQHLQSAALSYAALADHNMTEASQFLTEAANIIGTAPSAVLPRPALGKMVEFRRRTSPQMAGLLVMDGKGNIKFGTKLWQSTPKEVLDVLQKTVGTRRAQLAEQPFATEDGKWYWAMARGIDSSKENAALALIDVTAFLKEARSLAGNEDILVGLTTPKSTSVLTDYHTTQLIPLDNLDPGLMEKIKIGAG